MISEIPNENNTRTIGLFVKIKICFCSTRLVYSLGPTVLHARLCLPSWYVMRGGPRDALILTWQKAHTFLSFSGVVSPGASEDRYVEEG